MLHTSMLTTHQGPGQCTVQNPVVVMYVKKSLMGVGTLAKSPAHRMDIREISATKAADTAIPQSTQRHMCLCNT